MDKIDLVKKLASMNIPADSYSIGDIENEALCLLNKSGTWSIFYSERGQRTEEKFYDNENEACQAFLKRLTHMLGC
ncbi:hypothetical protein [Serratia ficaria]|uniref:hypothetical protein n=1 Tax=Serratia ficaria TaxID=61651 RepID=UPI0012B93826|nr:hypothetical protein [Serratia ficaria]CAI1254449.1 Uncharacterised protein [Serratia ficaria]CAI1544139.1 Uncharacterised protein [Serratia ficaria]CAI2408972.1 Uncharacterised protein [Serratia ficaria]CAI2447043.1 Uncharacterised protein [Serratia ficaria]